MEALLNMKTSLANKSDDSADISLTFMSFSVISDNGTLLRYALGLTDEVR